MTPATQNEFLALFSEAKLFATEIAQVLGVNRVTVERYKSRGFENCEPSMIARISLAVKVVDKAVKAKDLPFNNVTGKNSRLAALRMVIGKHRKSFE